MHDFVLLVPPPSIAADLLVCSFTFREFIHEDNAEGLYAD
jgi:hypothetical protein